MTTSTKDLSGHSPAGHPPDGHYLVGAIPLARPDVIEMLHRLSPVPLGSAIETIEQRPTRPARAAWWASVSAAPSPDVATLLSISDPHRWVGRTTTDRLIPRHLVEQDGFLSRSLGGWAPVFFGVFRFGPGQLTEDDPIVSRLRVLADHGDAIVHLGADPRMVADRLHEEVGGPDQMAATLRALSGVASLDAASRAEVVVEALDGASPLLDRTTTTELVLFDELMDALVEIETRRRMAYADGDDASDQRLTSWQTDFDERWGVRLLLKGEYVMGRHRRSTVLLAPGFGVVVKQPAPEPEHEAELGVEIDGRTENWPVVHNRGRLVTPHGRVRMLLDDGVVDRLHRAFRHPMRMSSLYGITVEPWISGPTIQEWVLADASRLTTDLYEDILLHQLVCERLDVENGDWHAANFVRTTDGTIVHVDWGAARPLLPEERTPSQRRARMDQVANLGYSFHDERLADRTAAVHAGVTGDPERLIRLEQRAEELVARI